MTILRFKSSDKLKKLASETLCRKEFQVPYQKKTTTKKLFWFVKDSGIYLMNGWGNQIAEDNVVVYAKGYNPESENCWDRCRDAVRKEITPGTWAFDYWKGVDEKLQKEKTRLGY